MTYPAFRYSESEPETRPRRQPRDGERPALIRKITVVLLFFTVVFIAPVLFIVAMMHSAPFFGTQPSESQVAESMAIFTAVAFGSGIAMVASWWLCFSIWAEDRFITGGITSTLLTLVSGLLLLTLYGSSR